MGIYACGDYGIRGREKAVHGNEAMGIYIYIYIYIDLFN